MSKMKHLFFLLFISASLCGFSKSSFATPTVGTYVSSDNGFLTSSYWIDGPQGVVVIDTQFLLSAAREVIARAEKASGKKVVAALVLHPNPDKFNGAAVFNKRGIPVYTSAQVLAKIPAVHELRKTWFYDRFKPDYPKDLPTILSFGDQSREWDIAGLKIKLHVMGKGCSDAHVVAEWEGHLFTGDLVTQGFHSWLELGYLNEWIDRISELEKLHAKFIHPGRGASGGPALLVSESDYLKKVLAIVRAAHQGHSANEPLTDELSEKIANQIESAYPKYRYPRFVENGIEEVWNRVGE